MGDSTDIRSIKHLGCSNFRLLHPTFLPFFGIK